MKLYPPIIPRRSVSRSNEMQINKVPTPLSCCHCINTRKKMKDKTMNFLHDEEGLTTVEYAMAGALIAAALVATFQALGLSVAGVVGNMAALVNP